ncbi:MAG: DUF3108 domain-containing protein [Deltaproteobacteria bacterium]|jgi:hypothetical protein
MQYFASTLLAIFGIMVLTPNVDAHPEGFPFEPGEKLTFEVRWAFIPAAQAVLEILPLETLDGKKAYHFVMTTETNAFADVFYKVRDRFDGYADKNMTRSLLYRKKGSGKHKRDITVTFDWEKREAQYISLDEVREPISILPGSFDPLSVFYAFRLTPLKEGLELQVPVADGRKCVMGKARVIRRETIKVRGVSYDTFFVEPDLEHVGGVFEKSPKASVQIWVTADENQIPVKLKSKVVVGSFVAELVSIEKH